MARAGSRSGDETGEGLHQGEDQTNNKTSNHTVLLFIICCKPCLMSMVESKGCVVPVTCLLEEPGEAATHNIVQMV